MSSFQFKKFTIQQGSSALKVGTDAMLLGAFAYGENPNRMLDVGCGTGVLSLMFAQNHPECKITAIDIDEESLLDCRFNFNQATLSNSFEVIQGDILERQFNVLFDVIVSNPPFYQTTLENQDKRLANAKHVQSLPPRLLMFRITSLLTLEGCAWIIIPSEDEKCWVDLAVNEMLFLNERIVVLNKIDGRHTRSILQFSKTKKKFKESIFHIRKSEGSYTEEYIQKTKEFHFKDLSSE